MFKVGDLIRFNKTTKKSIKDFFLASLINENKIYKLTSIDSYGEVIICEMTDDVGNILHCTVNNDFKFFNKNTKYRLFRRI